MKTKVLDHFHNQFTAKKGKSSELLVRTRAQKRNWDRLTAEQEAFFI